MQLLLILILLGVFTYFVVKRSVANITRTPIWILWLVIMTPPFIWSAWTFLNNGEDKSMPIFISIGPFVICPMLYWLLIQLGRRERNSTPNPPVAGADPKTSDDSRIDEASGLQNSAASDEGSSIRPINKTEEKNLRDCFPWSIYYLENIEYRPQAVVCRGKLRSNPQEAYQKIRENIEAKFGDRFFVLFQESINSKPFFALVPNPHSHPETQQLPQRLTRPGLALALAAIALYTTTVFGSKIAGVSGPLGPFDPEVLQKGLPYALALMLILGIHELGHYLCATRYKIRTTLPYFLPVPFFPGTFGAFIQMRDPVPNRKALFDVGIAGPLAGLIVTLPILIWGLAHSDVVSLTEKSNPLNFKSLNPRFSLLLTLLSKLALGSDLTLNKAIDLHPVAVAGCIGLVVTAFNLMPVGQLDGGHIVHAMFGQRTAVAIGQIARLLMLLLGWQQQFFLLWAIVLFFMPVSDQPCLNDVSELDNSRDFWGLLSLALLVIIVLPPPPVITQLLHV